MASYIQYIASYLPSNKLTNEQLSVEHPEWSVEKIAAKTGISSRSIASDEETSTDLAYMAAKKLIDKYQLNDVIDYVLFCTQSPDYFLPTSACLLQDKLGLKKGIGALDFNLGCSGYVYGLGLAKGLIASGQAKNILLITAETYSKFIHKNDKSNRTIFGDAATATLITSEKHENGLNAEIGEFNYGTDGSGGDFLIVKNGGARNTSDDENLVCDEEGNFISNDNNLFMNGKEIFNFTASQVPLLVAQNLEKNKILPEEVSLYVFHQANTYMLNFIRTKCKIPKEKFFIDIEDVGNTVSNTIPIAIEKALQSKVLGPNQKIILCGFGVGLSMGAVTIMT